MDELVTWLRAQIDEDERIALEAASTSRYSPRMRGAYPSWSVEDYYGSDPDEPQALLSQRPIGNFTMQPIPRRHAEHIARHDPARVLREVEAKRRIIDRYAQNMMVNEWPWFPLLELATVYADRPGYREEWRP